jgi:predicted DNA-binding transcriptional regulator YafY
MLRRPELAARFSMSPQQASQDIALYLSLVPGRTVLDPSTKAYVRAADGPALFPKDAFRWIAEESANGGGQVIHFERLEAPARRAADDVVAALIASYGSREAVEILYQSLSSTEPVQRIVCPHCIVDTGDRYHARCWDDLRRRFADFVLGRIISAVPKPGYPWVDAVADTLWAEQAEIVLAPAPGLSRAQRRVVEQDFGMEGGRVVASVRKALVTYVADRLGVLDEIQGLPARRSFRQLQCLNARELATLVPSENDSS